jgi:hypothetical protein
MPEITVYINCDTRLAINLRMFELNDNDEFIFVIKNYDYISSDYEFIYRARKSDIDENGEIIFKITPETSKHLKPGAFYNFTVLANAFDLRKPTEYKKLTENGAIRLEYGAQDLIVKPGATDNKLTEYSDLDIHLERVADNTEISPSILSGALTGISVEQVD